MSSLWQKIMHPRREGLVKELATVASPATPNSPVKTAVLDTYLDKKSSSDNAAIRENQRILSRTRALSEPQREHATAAVRDSLQHRCPELFDAVESLLLNSQMRTVCELLLQHTYGVTDVVSIEATQISAYVHGLGRALDDTLKWAEALTRNAGSEAHEAALGLNTFFDSPVGKRWMNAVLQALNAHTQQTARLEAPPAASVGRSPLARLLSMYIGSANVNGRIVRAARRDLEPGDVGYALRFFRPDQGGGLWLSMLAGTLADMREGLKRQGWVVRRKSL